MCVLTGTTYHLIFRLASHPWQMFGYLFVLDGHIVSCVCVWKLLGLSSRWHFLCLLLSTTDSDVSYRIRCVYQVEPVAQHDLHLRDLTLTESAKIQMAA